MKACYLVFMCVFDTMEQNNFNLRNIKYIYIDTSTSKSLKNTEKILI
jgi:hypothetical protein